MTVCVTALCDAGNAVVGVADRMLTAEAIQFEPQLPKIRKLTSSTAILWAGDSSLQTELLMAVSSEIQARVELEPNNWWLVRDVADLYAKHYRRIRNKRAESHILSPLGLDPDSYIKRQRELEPSIAEQVARRLTNFELPSTEAIITGSDPTGVHIYVASRGSMYCAEGVGFAAIGIGGWHATSQLMFAGHTKFHESPGTAYLLYAAKRHAEVAPGVGAATDMFLIFKQLGSYTEVSPQVIGEMEKRYKKSRAQTKRAEARAEESFKQYISGPPKGQPAEQAESDADPGDTTVGRDRTNAESAIDKA